FPARFQLIAAMNPCPCGYFGDPSGRCRCTGEQIRRYQGQTSGPLLDRIDLHVEVPALPPALLQQAPPGESSATVQSRVMAARQRQWQRQGCANAALDPQQRGQFCALQQADEDWFLSAIEKLQLSARGYHRLLKIARTVADLALLQQAPPGESSATVQSRVMAARQRQWQRQGCANAALDPQQRGQFCALQQADEDWFLSAIEKLQLSARGYHRLLKIARTVADL